MPLIYHEMYAISINYLFFCSNEIVGKYYTGSVMRLPVVKFVHFVCAKRSLAKLLVLY